MTAANWREVAALTVAPGQEAHVAPVTYYLCLCAYGDTWRPLAILRDGAVVGFCMEGIDDDGSRWVGGLVIGGPFQRQGIARQALLQLIERCDADPDCPGLALSYRPENTAARSLYAGLGLRETGETEDGGAEVVARRPRSG